METLLYLIMDIDTVYCCEHNEIYSVHKFVNYMQFCIVFFCITYITVRVCIFFKDTCMDMY